MPASSPASRARRGIDIAWAVIPGIALALVMFYTWAAMHGTAVAITGAVS
jgi:hypothetical protein